MFQPPHQNAFQAILSISVHWSFLYTDHFYTLIQMLEMWQRETKGIGTEESPGSILPFHWMSKPKLVHHSFRSSKNASLKTIPCIEFVTRIPSSYHTGPPTTCRASSPNTIEASCKNICKNNTQREASKSDATARLTISLNVDYQVDVPSLTWFTELPSPGMTQMHLLHRLDVQWNSSKDTNNT